MFSVGKLLAYAFECRCFSITFGSFRRVIQTWTKQNKKTTTTTKTKKSKYFLILTLSNLCIMKSVLSSPHKIISHDAMTIYISFFYQGFFFHGHWQLTAREGRIPSTTSTRSRTFRQLFATLHLRWLSHIFNRTSCIYQAATRWDLPLYRITIWLIDVMLTFVLFACWFDFRFCYGDLTWETGGTRTCIDYHPCITSEPTNQVC